MMCLIDMTKRRNPMVARPFRRNVFRHFMLIAGALYVSPQFVHAESEGEVLRIDMPVTTANSVLVNVNGGVLRMPRALASIQPGEGEQRQPIKVQAVGFTFWYPDMTVTPLLGGASDRHISTPPNNSSNSGVASRLKVYVAWMTYSSDQRSSRAPRPSDIVARETEESIKFAPPDIIDTPYPNLRVLSFVKAAHLERPNYKPAPEAFQPITYIEGVGSPYELFMLCSSACSVTMYSKKHHYQLNLWIYGSAKEVAPQADQILTALNKVVESWNHK